MDDTTEGVLPARLQALEHLGVQVHHDYEYRGEVGPDRHRVTELETVTGVYLPLSPLEWISLCMRDHPWEDEVASAYVGGCCGNMGLVQDTMEGVFRSGGWFDSAEILRVGELCRGHDGFEDTFKKMSDDEFAGAVSAWTQLDDMDADSDPWDKIGIVFNAVEPFLKQASYEIPSSTAPTERHPEEHQVIHVLHRTLSGMSWADMFTIDDPEDLAVHKANRVVLQARAYPMVVRLHELLDEVGIDFHGYGIVREGTDELMHNMRGLCVYPERVMAERMVELWKRQETEASAREKHNQSDEPHEPEYVTPPAEIVHVNIDKTGVHIERL